jgi:NitT/TauT family transport system substrate-binding protein
MSLITRRAALGAGLAAGSAALLAPRLRAAPRLTVPAAPICRVADSFAAPGEKRSLKLTWNASAICTVGVPVALERGIFARNNLDVELINFGGSTDQLLEAIATGKADAGVGMALRWLKPLEQGFDVRITTGIHGGCMRLFAASDSGITKVEDLKGKVVGTSDLASPDRNFFSIMAAKRGLDPNTDITWRAYPADLLSVALRKGEIQALTLGDPLAWIVRDREHLVEVANNLSGEYADRVCCVLGVRGALIRNDRPAAAAVTASILEAQDWVAANPDAAAAVFAPYSKVSVDQLSAMLRSHTHHHHPGGAPLQQEIALYAQELKDVGVLKPRTDPRHFATRVTADVLSA